MSIKRKDILDFINYRLNISDYHDYCVNGLQVEGKKKVKKIVFGVSISQELINDAVIYSADMIIVHHGLFWKSDAHPFFISGVMKKRLSTLLSNNINLAAYHLPLDGHLTLGNNIQIADNINEQIVLIKCKCMDGLGVIMELEEPTDFCTFSHNVNKMFGVEDKNLEDNKSFLFGKKKVRKVFIMSGAAGNYYPMALKNGVDTFITGCVTENQLQEIGESKLNLIVPGHYNSEKFGIQALKCEVANTFKEKDLKCIYLDIPNPM